MPNSKYWQERMEALEDANHQKGRAYTANVEKQFRMAQKSIEDKINYWYARIAENNEITMQGAKRLLRADELEDFKMSVEEYIEKGKTLNYSDTWKKQLENASAKVHISRLEALKMQMQQECEVLYGNMADGLDDTLRNMYTNSYYHTAYEMMKGHGVGWAFNRLDTRRIEKAINTVWTNDGKRFSDRVWANKSKLVQELNTVLTQNIIRGESPQKAISQLAKRMNVSRSRAGTLIMTESAFIHSQSQKDCYTELGAEKLQFVATLDNSTSEICQSMDGVVIDMKDYKIGLNVPPLHPNCRSCMIPHYEDNVGMRAARGENGKTYLVPSDMTFKDWKKSFVDGGDKSNLTSAKSDDINDYLASKKQYNDNVKKLQSLEKETDDALDKYMDAIDTPDEKRFEKLHGKKYDELENFREVVKDLKAELSSKEAKAVRHIEKNLANMMGVDSSKVNMTGLPYNSADMVYKSYKVVLNKYPELKGHLTQFTSDDIYGKAYAGCNALTGKVVVHGVFRNFDDVVKKYADDVARKFHPVGTDHNSIIVHELGHALDGYMTKNGILGGKITAYGTIRSATEIRKQVLDKLDWTFEKTKTLRESLKTQGLSYKEINDELEKQRNAFIKEHISEYACDNENEFFAECFAEYVMSDSPREAAKIFGEIIDAALGR